MAGLLDQTQPVGGYGLLSAAARRNMGGQQPVGLGGPLGAAIGAPMGDERDRLAALYQRVRETPTSEGIFPESMREFGAEAYPYLLEALMFGGTKAKNAPLDDLARAEAMEKAGGAADDIWRATGWGRGADGKWRFEIDDSGAQYVGKNEAEMPSRIKVAQDYFERMGKPREKFATGQFPDHDSAALNYADSQLAMLRANAATQPVEGVFSHSGVYDAYPDAKNIEAARETLAGVGGTFKDNRITYGGVYGQERSHLLHELQHAVQQREGFARGGSPAAGREIVQSEITAKAGQMRKRINEIVEGDKDIRRYWYQRNQAMAEQNFDKVSEVEGELLKSPLGTELLDLDWEQRSLLSREYDPEHGVDAYKRLAGEVEARNVQTRMDMDAATRRQTPPTHTEDVPRDQQIVRGLLNN